MDESILNTIKKMLGLAEDYTAFDQDVIAHINSALMVLAQIGVGPEEGILITDASTTWNDLVGGYDVQLSSVVMFVLLSTKTIFDPPTNSSVLNAMKETKEELEWRLNVRGDKDYNDE